jgi:group I intron endonuclease
VVSLPRSSGLYEIVNLVNGKRYIGSAKDIRERWYKHHHRLRKGTHHSPALQNSWDAHGEKGFAIRPLLLCSEDNLLFYEQRCLDVLRPELNGCPVAGRTTGYRHTEETRARMRAIQQRLGAMRAGVPANRPISDITRQRMSEAARGRTLSPEARAKVSAAVKGRKPSEKALSLIRGNKYALGYRHTPEAIAKITEKARNPSPETRLLLQAAANKRWAAHRERIANASR